MENIIDLTNVKYTKIAQWSAAQWSMTRLTTWTVKFVLNFVLALNSIEFLTRNLNPPLLAGISWFCLPFLGGKKQNIKF